MSALIRRAGRPALPLALTLLLAGLLAGCGGFGGNVPPKPTQAPIRSYVALGDGFVAAPYDGAMDRARGCLRSKNNYAAQVASRLGVAVTDVSCTGATTQDVLQSAKAPEGAGRLAAQIDAVKPDTDLVTITIGISDNLLLYRGFYVCMAAPCGDRIPPQTLGAEAVAVGSAISRIVSEIQAKAPKAYIVLVGYPRIAPQTESCRGLPSLDAAQIIGVNALFNQLNEAMQNLARQTGSAYADLSQVSNNHDICSASSWIRAATDKPSTRAALHPLPPEQRAAADAILLAVSQR